MTVIHTASDSSLSTALTATVPSSGTPVSALRVQPLAPGVSTVKVFLTSSSTLSTRWFLVQVAPASEVVWVGSNSASNSRLPAMKSSNFVTSSEPAGYSRPPTFQASRSSSISQSWWTDLLAEFGASTLVSVPSAPRR